MSGPVLTAVAFALTAGQPSDAQRLISVDTVAGPRGRRLLASVEPLEPSARGFDLAALALDALKAAFAAASGLPPADALARGLEAANDLLLTENQPNAGCRWDRRVFAGATAIAVEGRHLTIAQVPATQALIVQDRQLYSFPDLASWRSDYLPPTDALPVDPLGYRPTVVPTFYRTIVARGDLLVLCSCALARCLARSGATAGDPRTEVLLTGDLDGTLDWLERIVVANDLDTVHVAGVVFDRLPGIGLPVPAPSRGSSRSGAWGAFGPHRPRPALDPIGRGVFPGWGAGRLQVATAGLGIPLDQPVLATVAGDVLRSSGNRNGDSWDGRLDPIVEQPPAIGAPAPLVAGGPVSAAALGVRASQLPPVLDGTVAVGPHVGRARLLGRIQLKVAGLVEWIARPRPVSPHFEARLQGYVAPGARTVRCYRSQHAMPIEWRARLPRGLTIHLPGRLVLLLLVLVMALGTSGMTVARQLERSEQATDYVVAADGYIATAAMLYGAEAVGPLERAWQALEDADRLGADEDEIAQRRVAVATNLDAALGAARLTDVVRIGTLPAEVTDSQLRLIRTGRDVFLVGGGLYQIDADARRLVRLLAPGQVIGDTALLPLRDGGWGPHGIVAIDGTSVVAADPSGRWVRRTLGFGGASLSAIRLYNGNLYGIDAEHGRLLKFSGDDMSRDPEEWAIQAAVPELTEARDLVIDGQVHVLLNDGRVMSLTNGQPRATLTVPVEPAIVRPVALDGGLDSNFLYVAEPHVEIGGTTGRIVRIDRQGRVARQLLAPLPDGTDPEDQLAHALAGIVDLVVDEEAATVWFLTTDAVWRATLPGA